MASLINIQRDSMLFKPPILIRQLIKYVSIVILGAIRHAAGNDVRLVALRCLAPSLPLVQWKVLVVDEKSKKLLDNTVKEDDILNHNVTSE